MRFAFLLSLALLTAFCPALHADDSGKKKELMKVRQKRKKKREG